MVLEWWEYALNAAIFAGVLLAFAGLGFSFARVRVQKWIGGAIGNFMTNLANQAAEEEGMEGSSTSPGTLKLGGFQVDVGTIKELMKIAPQIIQLAQMFGLMKGGGGGGAHPFSP